MLSKLYYACRPSAGGQINFECVTAVLESCLRQRFHNVVLEPHRPGGTLGVFFKAVTDGRERFVKTHLPGEEYHHNLQKEAAVFKALYGDCLDVESVDIQVQGQDMTFLLMNFLSPLREPFSAPDVQAMIAGYCLKLSPAALDLPGIYTFERVYTESKKALNELAGAGLIENGVAGGCREAVEALCPESFRLICHGDLSNKNIMLHENRPVIIDWEDAFLGPEHYDICYWLTFFDQRKLYSKSLLGSLGIPRETAVPLMVVITVLKCYLSFVNESYKSNSLSFDERLREILSL